MDFIKTMKKREFIEMGLKTLAGILAAFLAIILMEGMIYGIKLNKIIDKTGHNAYSSSTIAYCIKGSDDKYSIIYYNEDIPELDTWTSTKSERKTKEECLQMEGDTVKEVVMHAPNAFELTITPTHFVVMGVFVLAVVGYFTYKFVRLSIAYKKTEEEFLKTGTIEITNV